jgi:hypothetical protein
LELSQASKPSQVLSALFSVCLRNFNASGLSLRDFLRALWKELMAEKRIKIEQSILDESAMWLFKEEEPVHDFETHWDHHSRTGGALS